MAGDRYQVNLWLVPYRGGRARRLTHGRWSDTARPGRPTATRSRSSRIAGTAAKPDDDTGAELYLIDPDGGEAERVCKAPHDGVGAPLWSPDGRAIAFVSSGEEVRFWTGDPKKHVARVIRTTDWQDDSGTNDRRSHLFVVAARPGARPRQVTTGDFDVSQPSWHPSGKRLAFTSILEPDADIPPEDPHSTRSPSAAESPRSWSRSPASPSSPSGRPTAAGSRSSAPTSPARPTTRSPPCGCGRARTSAA